MSRPIRVDAPAAVERPSWKGPLQLAELAVAVHLVPMVDSRDPMPARQLHAGCHTPINRRTWCATCEQPVPAAEVVSGVDVAPDRFVLIEPAEAEAMRPPTSATLAITHATEADLWWARVDRGFYVVPEADDDPSWQVYEVIRGGLIDRKAIGRGVLAFGGQAHAVAVVAEPTGLAVYTLHALATLRPLPARLQRRPTVPIVRSWRMLAQLLIDAITGPAPVFVDPARADRARLIAAKRHAGDVAIRPPALPRMWERPAIAEWNGD